MSRYNQTGAPRRIKMKSVELTVQEQWNFCLCSALQPALREKGMDVSQNEIAKNLTPAERGFLPHDKRIKQFMLRKGFDYSYFGPYETPFNEPDELLKEMCEHYGILGINNHVYALKSFDKDKVKLIDPKNGKEVEIAYPNLLKRMGFNGFFGLIKHIS